MKPIAKRNGESALTLVEVLVVAALVAILILVILPKGGEPPRYPRRVQCVSNLKQMGLSLLIYATENKDLFPMQNLPENLLSGDVVRNGLVSTYRSVASTLEHPKTLICPADDRHYASNFNDLKVENTSYFLSLDAKEGMTNTILGGDRNIEVAGQRVKPGIFTLTTNITVSWTKEMHGKDFGRPCGNVMRADGSVQLEQDIDRVVGQQEISTNRLIVP